MMNSFQIDFLGLSLMNNTFVHFIAAGLMLALFVWGLFFVKEEQKDNTVAMMKIWFVAVLLSGAFVWTLVDFSIPLLLKSIGGIFLFWVMLQLVKNPKHIMFWGLFMVTTGVGLGLALTSI